MRTVRIGIFAGHVANGPADKIVQAAQAAADDGFATIWLPQIFGMDALTVLAVVGHEVPGIELGTAVVPTFPRHPMVMAQQALTVQSVSGGRLVLGIGLSHQPVIEGMFGLSFEKPVRHLKEYLAVLVPLLRGESVSYAGETISTNAAVDVRGASPVPVLVAALGPQMLSLTGRVAEGTVTWMTGPKTIEQHVVPTITRAAEEAGRPAPRVAVGLPVCVTDDAATARRGASDLFQIYGTLPSYRAMLDREGVEGPADVAIVGNEDEVRAAVEHLASIGATDFVANIFGSPEERERTRNLLQSLL